MPKDVRAKVISNASVGGNYYRLGLKTGWSKFDPGQFVMIRIPDKNVFVRRPFSISRSIESDSIEILYKVVGKGTDRLRQLKAGEEIALLGPLGNGFSIGDNLGSAVLVSGGFGIAPFIELAKCLSIKNIKTTLYHGGKGSDDILLLDDFKAAGVDCRIATEDGSIGHQGLIAELLLKDVANVAKNSMIYCCGPKGLNEAVIEISRKNSIPTQISYETYMGCGLGVCLGCVVETKEGFKRACREGPVFDVEELP